MHPQHDGMALARARGATLAPALVGMVLEEAVATADQHDVKLRVVELDGKPSTRRQSLRPGRINLRVKGGHVVEAVVEDDVP